MKFFKGRLTLRPEGIWNAYYFQIFNTISFNLVNGGFMILYFKRLEASATVLGILAALAPLTSILQIPSAHLVEKFGYRSFVLKGWTSRACVIFFLAASVLLPEGIPNSTRLVLILFLLFAYNTLRGISMCGFLPWISVLVPKEEWGTHIYRDYFSGGVAAIVVSLSAGLFLMNPVETRWFGLVLMVGFVAAMISLYYLRRMPDVPVPAEVKKEIKPNWREILGYAPFRRFLKYTLVVSSLFGSSGAFYPSFMRDSIQASEMLIMFIGASALLVMSVSLWMLGIRVDKVGSRPMLVVSGFILAIHYLGWCLIGAHVLPFGWPTVLFQVISGGWAVASYNLASLRLLMGIVPERGKSHSFAYFSVINSLVLGGFPIFWGLVLDYLKDWCLDYGDWHFNKFSIFYATQGSLCFLALLLLRKVEEPKAITTEAFVNEFFLDIPRRVLAQIFTRRPMQ